MANKQGTNQIVDAFIGDKLIEARYIGQTKYFDPYTTLTGTLPLSFNARAAVALKNYRIHGTSEGAGVETENLFDYTATDTNNGYMPNKYLKSNGEPDDSSNHDVSEYIEIEPNTIYTLMLPQTQTAVWMSFYDSNKTFIQSVNEGATPNTITSPTTAKYLRITIRKNTATKIMLVKGSTVPTTYIPFGYKIPILCQNGKDIWNGTVTRWDAWNTSIVVTDNGDNSYTINYSGNYEYPAIQFVKVLEAGKSYKLGLKITGLTSALVSQNNIILGLRNRSTNSFVSGSFIHLTGDGNWETNVIAIETTNTYFSLMFSHAAVQFSNIVISDIVIEEVQQSNYDLMIGSTKLGAEEYLDYGEQKVYKRTKNLFDKNAKDTNNGYVRWHCIISTGAVTQDSSWDVTEYINVKPSTVYTASNCVGVTASICFYDTNKEYISGIPYSLPKPGGYGTLTFTTPNNCAYARTCVLTVNQSGAGYEFERNVDVFMITEGSTAPQSYIPYLQPTDPPAPLPAIQAYQGENTLSSAETVGEVSVKGRIRELTYRRVEYLKSTGTQYIQTDIVPTNTTKTVLDVEFGTWKLTTHSDPERGLIGADSLSSENKSTEVYKINLLGTVNSSDDRAFSFYAGYGWRDGIGCYLYNPAIPSRNILILQSNMGSWGSASISLTEAKTLREPTLPMPIFGNARLYEATGSIVRSPFKMTNMSLYSCKIYDSGNALSHNLVPVEREDGELGLLDEITGKFYTNAGTGTFVKGGYVDT